MFATPAFVGNYGGIQYRSEFLPVPALSDPELLFGLIDRHLKINWTGPKGEWISRPEEALFRPVTGAGH